jgi:C-terminal processing protease CtpA/Prc
MGYGLLTKTLALSMPILVCVTPMPSGVAEASSVCGWAGVRVSPMTHAVAESLGMIERYGAIFDRPKAGSPAAHAGIEAGDVLTTINGTPLRRASDFALTISTMAPGSEVYFGTWRNEQQIEVKLVLGSGRCPSMHPKQLPYGKSN